MYQNCLQENTSLHIILPIEHIKAIELKTSGKAGFFSVLLLFFLI